MKKKIQHRGLTLEYLIAGSGESAVLCFHGFGRKAEDFLAFQSLLKPGQRIISINLFAHEGSFFPKERIEKKPLKKEEWKEILESLLEEEGVKDFDLLGYSMGGRIAMTTLLLMPERVRSLLLIAPDGIKINALYKFASGTKLGRWIYRGLIRNPKSLFRLADRLHKWKFINDKLHRFVYVHLDSLEKRQLVYDVWLIHKDMFPDLRAVAALVREGEVRFNMVFGKHDSVITPALGKKMSELIGSEKHYHEIESGHRLINENTAKYLEENKLWPE